MIFRSTELGRIVSARSWWAQVPPDLFALNFHERQSPKVTVRLCAVGDIGLSGNVDRIAKQTGYASLFQDVAHLLRSSDLVFGNLEGPLVNQVAGQLSFAGSPTGAAALADAGFTMLSLANNHIYDYDAPGLASTLAALNESKLVPLGAGANLPSARELVRTDVSGTRIGWLGCGRTMQQQADAGPNFWEFNEAELLRAIQQARSSVDVLIVSIHIGLMYLDYPHPDHKAMAQRLVKAGADLVLMHHAHVLQGIEVTDQKSVVCYNLGNFVFDWQEGNVKADVMVQEQNEGAVFLFDLDKQGICRAAALPTWIDDDCRVRWALGERGLRILQRLARISKDLDSDYSALFLRQRSQRNVGIGLKVMCFHLIRGNWPIVYQMLKNVRGQHLAMLLHWMKGSLFFAVRRSLNVR